MTTSKIAVSLPGELLSQIDSLARKRHTTRSALIRESMERVLQTEQEKQTVERARLIYAEIAAEDLAWAAAYAPLVAETLPAYESAKAEE